jgi:hypothetical protein
MAKLSERKKLVKEADRVFSLYIRARDVECVVCGSWERLQCGHVFTRAYYSTRWDEENAFCQCASCNYRHEFDPMPLYAVAKAKLGAEGFEALYRKARQTRKFYDDDLRGIIAEFKKKKEELSEKYFEI